jgi:hypothetical protein
MAQKPQTRKKPTGFEKWLNDQKRSLTRVRLNFALPPRHDDLVAHLSADVVILEVDPTMILVEFSDGESGWVARDILTYAAIEDGNIDEDDDP